MVLDIRTVERILYVVSVGPTFTAMDTGELESMRPVVRSGIVYARSQYDKSLNAFTARDRMFPYLRL